MNDSRIYITFNVLGKQKGLNPPVELFCTEYGQPIFEVFINYSAFMLFLWVYKYMSNVWAQLY